MESDRSDLARPAVELPAAAADPDLEAYAGAEKGNKNRPFPQALTETTSSWTGQKKTKIRAEHSSAKIVGGQKQDRGWFHFLKWNRGENWQEEIDGLDWDDDKLQKEIDGCLGRMKDNPFGYLEDSNDDSSLTILDEQKQRELYRRIAVCRLRARFEETYKDMDDEALSASLSDKDLDDNDYFSHCEYSLEWYFDRGYCLYAEFQDYQRLVLRNRNDVEYEDWQFYRNTCSTFESDQDYVHFWEKLSSTTQLINWYITRTTCESETRIEKLFYYNTLKIAAEHPNVYKILVNYGCEEFMCILRMTFISSLRYVDFFFEMWKLLTREKLYFEDALKRLFDCGKHFLMFLEMDEFEPNVRPMEELYKPLFDRIGEKPVEEAKGLIMDYLTEDRRLSKTYYDYAKKKLGIAEKIGLIPSPHTKAPRDKTVHEDTVKQGFRSKEG